MIILWQEIHFTQNLLYFNMKTAVSSILGYNLHLESLNFLNVYAKYSEVVQGTIKSISSRRSQHPKYITQQRQWWYQTDITHAELVMKVHAAPFDPVFLPRPIIICRCCSPTSFPLSSRGWIRRGLVFIYFQGQYFCCILPSCLSVHVWPWLGLGLMFPFISVPHEQPGFVSLSYIFPFISVKPWRRG